MPAFWPPFKRSREVELAEQAQQDAEARNAIDNWLSDYLIPSVYSGQFAYGNASYPVGLSTSYGRTMAQEVQRTLPGYSAALRQAPPAFAAQMVRALVLSQARLTWRSLPSSSSPRRIFGTRDLAPLERPWPNGTTGELISRMEWHAGLAGNAYVTNRTPGRLRVLRPDWVAIVYGSQMSPEYYPGLALDGELLGYVYQQGGIGYANTDPHLLLPDEVAHWSPIPDPEYAGLGMSWVTPAVREIQGDVLASSHKIKFFENGAPQPLSAKILTPTGWSTMGAVVPGSQVIGSDGKPHDVLAVYPQGEQDVYRVTFSSGAQVECTADHLWTVANAYDRKRGTARTVTLGEIMAGGVTYASGPAKWSVPLVEPVQFDAPAEDLPVDPYLLGSLLGDGCLRGNHRRSGSPDLACHTDDVDEQARILASLVPDGVRIVRQDGHGRTSRLRLPGAPGATPNPLTTQLRNLGLWGLLGHDKYIPEQYLRGSVTQRVALLQGLIDTDGSVDKRQPNTIRFDNTSRELCRNLADLVGGLGGIATVRPGRSASGASRAQWSVTISRLPEWITPCRLERKARTYRPPGGRSARHRYIQRVEQVRRDQVQCIAVESEDHLYVTDGYVLTHNTPNLVVKGLQAANPKQFNELVDMLEDRHAGVGNAYRTLYLTQGADATVVGADLKQIDFKATQGTGETRIAMLSRVHPVILGASEGLAGSSLNAGNFGQARRIWADTWIFPMLQDLCRSLAPLVKVPGGAELWFDTVDMPLLREDAKDAADIAATEASAITTLAKDGFTRESAVAAVVGKDMTLLKPDPDWVSVQVQPSGAKAPAVTPTGGAG